MDNTRYEKVLFTTAMLVMGCDGEIHSTEIQEVKVAFGKFSRFKHLNFQDEVDRIMLEFRENKKSVVASYFDQLETGPFDPVQKLQILEFVLRIMYADKRIDENEIRFLRLAKARLGVPNEVFVRRFGELDVLPVVRTPDKLVDTVEEFVNEVDFPDLKALREK